MLGSEEMGGDVFMVLEGDTAEEKANIGRGGEFGLGTKTECVVRKRNPKM